MNGLVSIDGDRITVSGRLLHEWLGVGTAYKDWFPRMCGYGFAEGVDFNPRKIERVAAEGGREVTREIIDHELTIDMAKEIAMIQRTPQGKAVREYFIQVEKNWNKPEVVMARAIKIMDGTIKTIAAQNEKLAAEIETLKPKAQFADALSATDGCILVREMAKILTQNGFNVGQNNLYDALVRAGLLFRKHGAHREEYEPTQYAMGMGLFRIVKSVVTRPDKSIACTTVKVTPKGQKYLLGRFAPDGGLPLMIAGVA